jgi:Arc/MetJ-type ribon-helix-helix transcriptional regulator
MAKHVVDQMRKLLAEYEHAAEAIRTTLGLLNGHATAAKQNGHASTITDAMLLDAQRRTAKAARATAPRLSKNGKTLGRPKKTRHDAMLQRRRDTEAFLAAFETTTPITLADVKTAAGGTLPIRGGLGTLLRHGYLKRKGGGFIRTSKAFVVDTRASAAPE